MSGGADVDLFGLVGYRLDDKYGVEAAVARGGFGVVYKARHAVLQTPMAVKVLRLPDDLPPSLRGRFLEQFVEEARIIGQLQHPAIVRVTDFGVSTMPSGEQAPWMVLDWIEGETLANHLNARRGRGGQSPRACLDLLRPVIDALAVAHEQGIAHRDIKPGNIMLPSEPAASLRASKRAATRTSARVLDFGIAKIMGDGDDGPASGMTRTHSLMPAFSPRYASPEQASGTRTGPWTDVHALGLVLTEMLTDRAPYAGADKMELHVQVMSPGRPTPARFGVDVGAWEGVLAKAMTLRPTERFADAGELLTALEAALPAHAPFAATFVPAAPLFAHTEPMSVAMPPADSMQTFRPEERPVPTPASPPRPRALAAAMGALLVVLCGAGLARWKRAPERDDAGSATASLRPATEPAPAASRAPAPLEPVARPASAPPAVIQQPVAQAPAPASPVSQRVAPPLPARPQHAQGDRGGAAPTRGARVRTGRARPAVRTGAQPPEGTRYTID